MDTKQPLSLFLVAVLAATLFSVIRVMSIPLQNTRVAQWPNSIGISDENARITIVNQENWTSEPAARPTVSVAPVAREMFDNEL